MAYNGKYDWKENDTVMPVDMNRIETGIKNIDTSLPNIAMDGGLFTEDLVEIHNTTVDTHGLMLVDGSATDPHDESATLSEHIIAEDAHQNLQIDGSETK